MMFSTSGRILKITGDCVFPPDTPTKFTCKSCPLIKFKGAIYMNRLLIAALTFLATGSFAQKPTDPTIFRITSAYTSFPDTARAKGHSYDNDFYTAAEHYSDSSVMIVVPPQFKS